MTTELAEGRLSLTGRRWRLAPADETLIRSHSLRLGVPEPLARALASRGVAEGDGADFLDPTLKALFPDPSAFADLDRAVEVILDALEAGKRLTVFADYDVDGATSAALLIRWCRALGHDLPFYVPDRLREGYGPSPAVFEALKGAGIELVITVDCGAAAHDALNAAQAMELPVVVVDHHLMRGAPPPARALINPNRPDCGSGQGNLSAAGVTFVLLAGLTRAARARGWFADRPEPDLRQWLDLAALGAICDVTRFSGFNRALVTQGLKVMTAWTNPGLSALMRVAGADPARAGVFEAGFVLGPRINAGGRIGRADLGATLLSTDDPDEAAAIAVQLDVLNRERQAVEKRILDQAIEAIERQSNFDPEAGAIVAAHEDWHPGVIGIVASRLRERYRKPVFVIGIDRDADMGRGSGRSQAGFNLGEAVQEAFEAGLITAGGGHAMAAGLSIRPALIPDFRAFLAERAARADMGEADVLDLDAALGGAGAAAEAHALFKTLAPFGPGNPEPLFALEQLRPERPMALRGGHVGCDFVDRAGGRLRAIAWRSAETDLGRRLLAGGGEIHVAGRLRENHWQGKARLQLEIEDIIDPRRA